MLSLSISTEGVFFGHDLFFFLLGAAVVFLLFFSLLFSKKTPVVPSVFQPNCVVVVCWFFLLLTSNFRAMLIFFFVLFGLFNGVCGVACTTTQPSTRNCSVAPGMRFGGGSGDNVTPYPVSNVLTAADCEVSCKSCSNCKQFVYYAPGKVCYQMDRTYPLSSATVDAQFTSGNCDTNSACVQPATGRQCALVQGKKFAGGTGSDNVLPSPIANVNTASDCQAQCKLCGNCKQFVYNESAKICYLMNQAYSLSAATSDVQFSSGYCDESTACLLPVAPRRCGNIAPGIRFGGGGDDAVFPYPVINVNSASECQSRCLACGNCKQFVYFAPGKVCYMMNKTYPVSAASADNRFDSGNCEQRSEVVAGCDGTPCPLGRCFVPSCVSTFTPISYPGYQPPGRHFASQFAAIGADKYCCPSWGQCVPENMNVGVCATADGCWPIILPCALNPDGSLVDPHCTHQTQPSGSCPAFPAGYQTIHSDSPSCTCSYYE